MKKQHVVILAPLLLYILATLLLFLNAELAYSIMFLVILSQSMNIALGFSGLVNLGCVAFLGVGAYIFSVLAVLGLNPYYCLIVGGCISMALSLLIGAIVLRLKGPFFAICTLSLASAIRYLIIGTGVAGGHYGIQLYKYIGHMYNTYALILILIFTSLIMTILTLKLSNSPFGYSLKALREDHDVAQTLGINTFKCKLIAFAISSFFPGVVGGIMAFRQFWVTPDGAFSLIWSVEAILALIIGGSGSVVGPIAGAIVYEILKDFLMRYFPGFQVLIFGILLIVITLMIPGGLMGFLKAKIRRLQKILI
ncbi:MAG: branched-chain amino acid ABC transporter permease [Candidatus Bathyarchaeia archaeon]